MSTSFPEGLGSDPVAVSESWTRLKTAGQLSDALVNLERAAKKLAEARGQAMVVHGMERAGAVASILADVEDAAEELRGLIGAAC